MFWTVPLTCGQPDLNQQDFERVLLIELIHIHNRLLQLFRKDFVVKYRNQMKIYRILPPSHFLCTLGVSAHPPEKVY